MLLASPYGTFSAPFSYLQFSFLFAFFFRFSSAAVLHPLAVHPLYTDECNICLLIVGHWKVIFRALHWHTNEYTSERCEEARAHARTLTVSARDWERQAIIKKNPNTLYTLNNSRLLAIFRPFRFFSFIHHNLNWMLSASQYEACSVFRVHLRHRPQLLCYCLLLPWLHGMVLWICLVSALCIVSRSPQLFGQCNYVWNICVSLARHFVGRNNWCLTPHTLVWCTFQLYAHVYDNSFASITLAPRKRKNGFVRATTNETGKMTMMKMKKKKRQQHQQ